MMNPEHTRKTRGTILDSEAPLTPCVFLEVAGIPLDLSEKASSFLLQTWVWKSRPNTRCGGRPVVMRIGTEGRRRLSVAVPLSGEQR